MYISTLLYESLHYEPYEHYNTLILTGVNQEGALVGQFCSKNVDNVLDNIAIPYDRMWLAFLSDASVSHEGFNISYQIAHKFSQHHR